MKTWGWQGRAGNRSQLYPGSLPHTEITLQFQPQAPVSLPDTTPHPPTALFHPLSPVSCLQDSQPVSVEAPGSLGSDNTAPALGESHLGSFGELLKAMG